MWNMVLSMLEEVPLVKALEVSYAFRFDHRSSWVRQALVGLGIGRNWKLLITHLLRFGHFHRILRVNDLIGLVHQLKWFLTGTQSRQFGLDQLYLLIWNWYLRSISVQAFEVSPVCCSVLNINLLQVLDVSFPQTDLFDIFFEMFDGPIRIHLESAVVALSHLGPVQLVCNSVELFHFSIK